MHEKTPEFDEDSGFCFSSPPAAALPTANCVVVRQTLLHILDRWQGHPAMYLFKIDEHEERAKKWQKRLSEFVKE